MQLHDLFEGDEQAYNWHSEPEQRNIDATRQARLYREREPEGSEAIDARLRAQNDQRAQYIKSGNFWLKQKDTQEHISDSFVGKAAANAAAIELLKQRPELQGNLVITAYGPSESQGVAEGYPKHQDLSGVSTEKLKAYLAKQGQQAVPGEGNQVKRVRAELQRRKKTGDPAPQHYRDQLAKDAAKYKKGVAEASPEATFNALKGLKSWQVVIMNNYYRGKYSDYSGRYYYVLATTPEEAKQVVLDNADAILQDLLAMKSHNGKKILPRSSAVPITADRIGRIEDGTVAGRMSTANYKKMYSPQGVMMVKLSNGAIADVQGQEQGVSEGELATYLVSVMDSATGEHWRIEVKVTSPEMAKERAEAMGYKVLGVKEKQGVAEGSFGSNYAERLAQRVYDENPELDTSGMADELLDVAFPFMVQDLGSRKRANYMLNYDEDFPSDFVSAYAYLQQGGAAHVSEAPGAETLSHNQSTVASNLNSLDLGEGDISQLEKDVAAAPVAPIANMEADEKIGGRYDPDDFNTMVGRLKKLAGAGPMKTVYDPAKRVYRNVPTAVQPAQQPKK
jgi:hypothetical protein